MNKRLFLSYGHSEEKICLKICQSLQQRGYDVWMDTSEIKAGDDWRRKIFEGISHSNGVIACLSKHACRKPGVCLNELSIAVGIKGGSIKTILLEDEEEVVPPAELCHSQWLDMHDWKEWEALGEEKFNDWFSMKMESLTEMIERESGFVGEIETIRKILNPNMSRSRQSALLAKSFWGRNWLAEKIENWMADPEVGRMLIIYGDPGIGKSAFAANYIHYNAKIAGGIFCERNNIHFNDPENIIRTIAFQLACRLPAYRKALLHMFSGENSLKDYNSSELFDLLLSDPLQNLYIDGAHETLGFVIDGLDECGDENENVLAQTLKRYADRLPRWLRFIVTSRELASVTSIFGDVTALRLRGNMDENMEDIKSYYHSCLAPELNEIESDSEREFVLNRLSQASKGIFLYAELMANSVHEGKRSINDTDHLPEGLPEMFYQWFEGSFPTQDVFDEKYRKFISLMLAVPEGVTEKLILDFLQIDSHRMHDILLKMRVHLAADEDWLGNETWVFSHQYIAEWLGSEQSGRFFCSKDMGSELLKAYLFDIYQKDSLKMSAWEIFRFISYLTDADCKDEYAIVMEDIDFIENAVHIGDAFVEKEAIDKADYCYHLLKNLFSGEIFDAACIGSRRKRSRILKLKAGVEQRLKITNKIYSRNRIKHIPKNMSRDVKQLMDESYFAELVDMVRKSLKEPIADRVAECVLFNTIEETRTRLKNDIHHLALQEKHEKQFRGPILTIPMVLCVAILIIISMHLVYVDGQFMDYFKDYGVYRVIRTCAQLILGCFIVWTGIKLYKTDYDAVGKRFRKSIWRLICGLLTGGFAVLTGLDCWAVLFLVLMTLYMLLTNKDDPDMDRVSVRRGRQQGYFMEYVMGCAVGVFLAGSRSVFYLSSLSVALWPVIVMGLATVLLYKEETYDLIYRRSHPVLWSVLYYSIVFMLIAVLTYRGRYYHEFVDQIGLIYMVLVADMAYLLFAKPRTNDLIRFSRDFYRDSLFDTNTEVGLDQDAILYKSITKRSVRILITILFNLLALVVLFMTNERVQKIARSIRCELSGVKCADNLGWLSFRLNALSQSIKGDYSSLNSQSYLAEALPISWIHSQYGMAALVAVSILVLVLLIMMNRYIQKDIESEFVISVQKLIFFAFACQSLLGIFAELFFFTNTNIKLIFLGNVNSLFLWILFMFIGKSRRLKRVKRRG